MWDVIVVGAGPSGSYAAYRLAKSGLRVQLIEEHPVVGEPRHCTGVLGREAFDRFGDLPRSAIQAELKGAWIISPGGERVRTQWFDGQAFVIHRAQFDQSLAQMASRAGARLRTHARVTGLQREADGMRVLVECPGGQTESLAAQTVVVASGIAYRFHKSLGLSLPSAHLYCAQLEADSDEIEETEVYVGRSIAPGSFAWSVPLGNGRVRVGVTAHRMAARSLEALIQGPLLEGRLKAGGEPIRKRPVPISPVACSVADRVLLVGDAAGQVKPTTGGGIYYGLIGADLAAQTLEQAFAAGRFDRAFLAAYDRRWKSALRREIWTGKLIRTVFERLSDERLDRLVRVCRRREVALRVQQAARFDWHGRTALSFLLSRQVLSQLF